VSVYQQTLSLWEHGSLDTPDVLNSAKGRGGLFYAPYGVGQSFLALPLYGLGKAVRWGKERAGAHTWKDTLAGPVLGKDADK
jgi:hypothetical protein